MAKKGDAEEAVAVEAAPDLLSALLAEVGVNLEAAKADLANLDALSGEEAIGDGTLNAWVDRHFSGKERRLLIALGRAWEAHK